MSGLTAVLCSVAACTAAFNRISGVGRQAISARGTRGDAACNTLS